MYNRSINTYLFHRDEVKGLKADTEILIAITFLIHLIHSITGFFQGRKEDRPAIMYEMTDKGFFFFLILFSRSFKLSKTEEKVKL